MLRRVEPDQGRVRGCVGSCGFRRVAWSTDGDQVRLVGTVDRVDRVVDRSVEDGEVAGWLDVRRLRTRCVHDRQQSLVPVDHWLAGLLGAPACLTGPWTFKASGCAACA